MNPGPGFFWLPSSPRKHESAAKTGTGNAAPSRVPVPDFCGHGAFIVRGGKKSTAILQRTPRKRGDMDKGRLAIGRDSGLLKNPFAYRGCDSCIRKAAKKPGTGSLSARKALPVPSVFSPPALFQQSRDSSSNRKNSFNLPSSKEPFVKILFLFVQIRDPLSLPPPRGPGFHFSCFPLSDTM